MTELWDTIIIGAGVSAYGAAMYAGRFEIKTLMIGELPGGTIVNTDDVANYPGFKMITGMDLADKLREHAEEYNITQKNGRVVKVEKTGDCFTVSTNDESFKGKTVIFATGTEWRKLGVPGEKEFTGKGVHYCALCDGAFYKEKVAALVGGSDSAAKDALLLAKYAKKVYIIYRKENIRAEPINKRRVEQSDKIEVIPNTNVLEIKGDKFVNKVILDKEYNGSTEFPIEGLFIDIGHIALSGLAKDLGVALNKKGEIIVDRHGFTNMEGVFAAGDVIDTDFKQAITGVAEGVTAAFNVYNYVEKADVKCFDP
ncbi:FAD-dependent oxidoreductase [Candidatus Woesearchaeota archaeon]|nr:FAD-dependent oxidoreductase [Candidatus Woesearchaeota archaeon]